MSAACCVRRRSRRRARKRAKGEISAAAAEGGRGPRDRARHQEAGRGRPASRSPTANSAAPGGISISSGASTASRSTSMDTGIAFAGVQHAQRGRPGHRQARLLRPHPMIEHFKFVAGAHQAHAEDHHPGAVGDLRPADADADRQEGLSGPWTSSSTISARPTRRRCARFADAGCRYLQLDEVFIAMLCDPKYRAADDASAATIRTSSARSTPISSTRRCRTFPPT